MAPYLKYTLMVLAVVLLGSVAIGWMRADQGSGILYYLAWLYMFCTPILLFGAILLFLIKGTRDVAFALLIASGVLFIIGMLLSFFFPI